MTSYYCIQPDGTGPYMGPYSTAQLMRLKAGGVISAGHLVARVGEERWTTVAEVLYFSNSGRLTPSSMATIAVFAFGLLCAFICFAAALSAGRSNNDSYHDDQPLPDLQAVDTDLSDAALERSGKKAFEQGVQMYQAESRRLDEEFKRSQTQPKETEGSK